MAISAPDLGFQIPHAGTWGNVATATAAITTAAQTNGAIFTFLRLPANTRLLDLSVINTNSSASTTMKFGYRAVDGTPVDDDYFMAAKAIHAASRIRADAALAPVVIAEDFHIIGTLGGADIATATTITVTATYEFVGA